MTRKVLVGDRVGFKWAGKPCIGVVVADRGNIGPKDAQVIHVETWYNLDEQVLELPAWRVEVLPAVPAVVSTIAEVETPMDLMQALSESVPDEEWAKLPIDSSLHHDEHK